MENPYTTLGVSPDATAEVIHRAYRHLAKRCHPDLYPGEALAEARFKVLSAANDVLCHSGRRGRFDREERAASILRQRRSAQDAAAAQAFRHAASAEAQRGQLHVSLTAEFLDAVNGATLRVILPDGSRRDVTIPPGTTDGEVLRVHRRGFAAWLLGAEADTLFEIHVNPHWIFVRTGQDISLDVAVTLAEAVLGGNVDIATPGGPVRLHIPAGSANGTKLRLNRRGVPSHHGQTTGDLYATLRVVLGTGEPARQPDR